MFALSFGIEDLLGLGINPGVILVLFLLAIIVPIIIVRIAISKKRYRCSECGEKFKLNLWKVHLGFHDFNGRNNFCPNCKKITWCTYLREDEDL